MRLVNLDFDEEILQMAMGELGLKKENLNTKKRKEDFLREYRLEMEGKKMKDVNSNNPQLED